MLSSLSFLSWKKTCFLANKRRHLKSAKMGSYRRWFIIFHPAYSKPLYMLHVYVQSGRWFSIFKQRNWDIHDSSEKNILKSFEIWNYLIQSCIFKLNLLFRTRSTIITRLGLAHSGHWVMEDSTCWLLDSVQTEKSYRAVNWKPMGTW
jgi:hypothetical protein